MTSTVAPHERQAVSTHAGSGPVEHASEGSGGGRERILQAAIGLFSERGYTGVSMQQLAEAAGITKATLYHHFADKADLFEEMMRDRFGHSQAELARSVDAGRTIRDKLVAFAMVLYGAERVDLSRLLGDFHRHVDQARQRAFWDTFDRPWTYLEGALAEAMAAGEIGPGDPKLIAQVCFSAFVGQVQIAKFESNIPSPTPDTAEAIADLLLSGLEPRS